MYSVRGMPDCQYSCTLQGDAPSDDAAAGESNLHKAAVEAYLEQTAIKQKEKDLQRQQMPSPPDAAVNFSPAVGEPDAACLYCNNLLRAACQSCLTSVANK